MVGGSGSPKGELIGGRWYVDRLLVGWPALLRIGHAYRRHSFWYDVFRSNEVSKEDVVGEMRESR